MIKRIVITLATLLLIGGGVAYWLFTRTNTEVCGGRDAVILIDSDDNADSLRIKLEANTIGWDILQRREPFTPRPGRYIIHAGDRLKQVYRRIHLRQQDPLNVTIPEVRLVSQLPERVTPNLMMTADELSAVLGDLTLIDSLGFTQQTLPALFIPNTYQMWWTTTPREFILRMHREWQAYWTDERRALASEAGLTPIQVATLASIVESETANNAEKPIIAGLYINRLRRNMPLQSDPTVIFAIGDFSIRRVLHTHLQVDSRYNTYRYKGLPPGPIRIPSINGLEAVLHYARHNYIYMCAKEDFSGTHNFATNLTEHNANARRYQQALNRRGIR